MIRTSASTERFSRVFRFQKSSFSAAGNCVEVAFFAPNSIAVRNSRYPSHPSLFFTKNEWEAFVKGVRNGEFDISEDI
jgi:hypothetical protein